MQLRLSTRMLQEVRVIDVEALGKLMNQLEQVTAWNTCSSGHMLSWYNGDQLHPVDLHS